MLHRRVMVFHLVLLAVLLLLGAPVLWARDCVGVVPAGGMLFWHRVEAGAQQAANELGVDLYFRGPTREGDSIAQRKVIELIVQRGCRALVIAPAAVEIAEQVSRLQALGIPTVYIDRDPGGAAVLGVIATDNYNAGVLAGQYMLKLLGGQGQVALLRLAPDVVSTTAREEGFLHTVREAGLEVVLDGYLGADSSQVYTLLHDRLAGVDGMFTPNGTTTVAAYAALKRLQLIGQIKLVGFDTHPALEQALQRGEIAGLLLQQPYQMGYRGVTLAVQAMRGQAPPATGQLQALPAILATPDNLTEPALLPLLAPRQ